MLAEGGVQKLLVPHHMLFCVRVYVVAHFRRGGE